MDLGLTAAEQAFRDEVRGFLAQSLTPDLKEGARLTTGILPDHGISQRWQKLLHGRGWAAPVDVVRQGEDVVVRASLPGIDPDDIRVTLEEDLLTIRGEAKEEGENGYLMRERRTGSFYRAIRLPDSVDAEKAETLYENGVLSITFPQLEAKKAKQLEIKVGNGAKATQGTKS